MLKYWVNLAGALKHQKHTPAALQANKKPLQIPDDRKEKKKRDSSNSNKMGLNAASSTSGKVCMTSPRFPLTENV